MNTWQYVVLKRMIEEIKEPFIYKAAVAEFADIATTYPAPEEGWTVQTLDDGKIFRFDGDNWIHVTTVTSGLWDSLSNDVIALQAEVEAGRGGESSLDDRFNLVEGEITAARKGEDTLEDKIDAIDSSLAEKANQTDLDATNETLKYFDPFIDGVYPEVIGVEIDIPNNTLTRLAGALGKTHGSDFDIFNMLGGRKRCNVADDKTVTAYYGDASYTEDGSNGQVMVEQPKFYYKTVPLQIEKIPDYAEINTFTVTAGASSGGDVVVTLNGVAHNVAVTSGDAINDVADKIRSASYDGWTASGNGAVIGFTATAKETMTVGAFSGGSTGATATVVRTIAGGKSIGWLMRKWRWYASDYPVAGMKINPNFNRAGEVQDYIYYPAYEGSLYDVSASAYLLADEQVADFTPTSGDKLCSIAGAKPASGLTQDLTLPKTRILANNRGTGWQQLDFLAQSAEVMLMMIELAGNPQAIIGQGVVNKVSGAGNEAEITGATTSLGNATGMATGTDGLVSVAYRGRENPYGNIWKWLDGLNIEAGGMHQAWWADSDFESNIKTAPYENAGITLVKTSGYISAIGYYPDCDFSFLPVESLGSSSFPLYDYFYQNHISVGISGFLVARSGGSWSNGADAGACYLFANYSSAVRNRYIGGCLLLIP